MHCTCGAVPSLIFLTASKWCHNPASLGRTSWPKKPSFILLPNYPVFWWIHVLGVRYSDGYCTANPQLVKLGHKIKKNFFDRFIKFDTKLNLYFFYFLLFPIFSGYWTSCPTHTWHHLGPESRSDKAGLPLRQVQVQLRLHDQIKEVCDDLHCGNRHNIMLQHKPESQKN